MVKNPDAIAASLQLKCQNCIRVSRQTHRAERMGNECSRPLQILQDYTFLKVIFFILDGQPVDCTSLQVSTHKII